MVRNWGDRRQWSESEMLEMSNDRALNMTLGVGG